MFPWCAGILIATNLISRSLLVRGEESEKNGKRRYGSWYAKVTGFELEGEQAEGEQGGEVDCSDRDDDVIRVLWFHRAMDLRKRIGTEKDPRLVMLKKASDTKVYLLGNTTCIIAGGTIKGEYREPPATFNLTNGCSGVIKGAVNISDLSQVHAIPADKKTICYRWVFNHGYVVSGPTVSLWYGMADGEGTDGRGVLYRGLHTQPILAVG